MPKAPSWPLRLKLVLSCVAVLAALALVGLDVVWQTERLAGRTRASLNAALHGLADTDKLTDAFNATSSELDQVLAMTTALPETGRAALLRRLMEVDAAARASRDGAFTPATAAVAGAAADAIAAWTAAARAYLGEGDGSALPAPRVLRNTAVRARDTLARLSALAADDARAAETTGIAGVLRLAWLGVVASVLCLVVSAVVAVLMVDRRRAEERIRHLAHHDALTGLPNRTLLAERLEQALARARRAGGKVAVLCLDLDRFKEVNDCHGHAAGDALLKRVAAALGQGLRETDTVARVGGDEFVILQAWAVLPDDAARLAERLIALVTGCCEGSEAGKDLGVSIGIAFFPDDGPNGETLLKRADTALYRAKAAGRGTYRIFEPEMDTELRARRSLERDLRAALDGAGLQVHFQPQARTGGRRTIFGFEALVRWPHPQRGFVPPDLFIPLAEECGLIRRLGEWVLRRACAEAAGWPPHLALAVNLSPLQFGPELPDLVAAVLAQTGLAAGRLELEITEGVLIKAAPDTLAVLARLRAMGVRIAMDDFGTGHSSLSYLLRFPFDRIKVDRSFVAELVARPDCASIVRAIIEMGAGLNVSVLAEGVETEEQHAILRAARCGEVQGYLIARPMPAEEVLPFLRGEALRGGEEAPDRGCRLHSSRHEGRGVRGPAALTQGSLDFPVST